ncbi:MAG TPA: hypothetical protein EYO59_09085, partial [Chromatiaceae bacterium]|nr:hypothetical protein [Chromatiaceae bacterium]
SVGAIARGKNVVVVGDPKQMPPTSFFSGTASQDDPDEEDLESILDQALAARLPHLRLTGHYRSKHETLIAFSNSKYYENSLTTYPAADTRKSAVSLRRVDGVYSKGKLRNNPIEAQAVVGEVVRRLLDTPETDQSIGIVTLNTEQKITIEDLLDEARRSNLDIEQYFHSTDDYDAVFVKNLESVQGDERDVIILSLGYGPVEPGGNTMSMNFGPLNKAGGERRLNVAITRATSEVVVFASFDSSMIDLSRTSATAVEHLKHYLEYADKGPIALAQQAHADYGIDQFDSDFEQAVAYALRSKGWRAQTQVGVSKFRIDLGIIHPDCPGEYLAGVECDGATYHSSPTARDRDRVRHLILENLGWRLVRLWSTDYFVDPECAIDRIDQRLNEILEDDRSKKRDAESVASVTEADLVSPSVGVSSKLNLSDRVQGALLGLAVGDAVGTAVEFKSSGSFPEVTDMIGGGPFGLDPGQWTDDTSLALCLAESLIDTQGFDPADQLERYLMWYHEGYWSSNGKCFDIGATTEDALIRFETNGDTASGGLNDRSAGNGSIMRLAPVPLYYCGSPAEAIHFSGESSRTTHGLPVCIDA